MQIQIRINNSINSISISISFNSRNNMRNNNSIWTVTDLAPATSTVSRNNCSNMSPHLRTSILSVRTTSSPLLPAMTLNSTATNLVSSKAPTPSTTQASHSTRRAFYRKRNHRSLTDHRRSSQGKIRAAKQFRSTQAALAAASLIPLVMSQPSNLYARVSMSHAA